MAFFAWGIGFYGHGFYIVALGRVTGWPAALLSSAVAGFWMANVASSLVLGRIIDRFGARPAIIYGTLAMAGGCFGIAAFDAGLLDARWQLLAIFFLMGSAYPGLAAMAISAALLPWFKRRLGIALGLGLTGASVGGGVMPPLMTEMTGLYGLGATMATIGLALVLSVLPIVVFLIRDPKQKEAVQELGAAPETKRKEKVALSRFLTDSRFWLITLASALSLGAQVGFLMHQMPLLQDRLGLAGAALAVSVAALSGAVGRFVLGALSGRLPLSWLAAGSYLIQAVGLVVMVTSDAPPMLYLASALAGFVIGSITMLPPLLLVDCYGSQGYGTAYGFTGAAMFLMGSVATAATGWMYDATGSYQLPLFIQIALHGAASLLILWHGWRLRRDG